MSEIVYDHKFTTIELTSDLGLNFSGNNPRLKHTGTGTFTIQSTQGKINISSGSTADDSLNLDSAGGLDIDAAQEISIETSDTTDGIKIAETADVPVDIGAGGGTFLLGKLGETAQFRGSLTVTGDLTVNGDTVSTNVIVNETEDPMLRLNEGATGSNAVDIGFVGDRGDDTNIGFFWDESADEFACTLLTNDAQLELTGTPQNTSISDYADFHAGTGEFDDTLYAAGQKFSVAGATGNTLVNQGTFTVTSTTNQANAIRLNTNAGTTETITVTNTQGTSESAITLTSTAGGVDIDAAATKDVNIAGGQVMISSKDNVANTIYLETNTGNIEQIVLSNVQGEGTYDNNNDMDDCAILLKTTAVGDIGLECGNEIRMNAADKIEMVSQGVIYADSAAGITLTTDVDQINALLFEVNGGTSEQIKAVSYYGTSVMTDGNYDATIQLISVAGGVGIKSEANLAGSIQIEADGGTSESIIIHSDQGTSVMTDTNSDASIQLISDAGGIGIRSTANLAGSIQIEADGGTTETIIIKSDQGNTTTSINLISDAGGITMTTNNNAAITIENDSTVGINTSNPDNTYALDVNGTVNSDGVYQNDSLLMPPGCIMPYAAATAPGGWLICNGQSVSRTTYAALFAVIGTTYGSADGSSFNVPNLQGKTIFGYQAADDDFGTLYGTGGSNEVTLTTTELPAHTHTGTTNLDGTHSHSGTTDTDGAHTHAINDPGHDHDVTGTLTTTGDGTVGNPDSGGSNEPNIQSTVTTTSSSETTGITVTSTNSAHSHDFTTDTDGAHQHNFTTNSTGSGQAFSVLNPYMTLNYIIKV